MEGGRKLQLSAIMTILSLFLNIATAVAKNDTISSSQPLTPNQTIVSAGQVFELGFFSPGNSNKWFIGIWYKKFPTKPKTVVWVANRDNPLSSSSGTLTIFENGKLILTNESGKTIWQSNQTTLSSNMVAQILDTGNFVVRRKEDNDPKNYLWQSFDYPTNTLLPGMKLGIDKKTGLNRFLTSWKNEDDPSSGGFFFKLNFNGFPEFILWKGQTKVYRSGPWNGLRLSGVLGLGTMSDIMNLTFVMDQNENTYSFQMTDSSNYSRLSLNPYGSLERFLWIQMSQQWNVLWYAPYDHCDMYKECGAFGICDTTKVNLCRCMKGFQPKNKPAWNLRDRSLGCARTIGLNCPNDGFIRVKNVKLPESSNAVLNGSMSLEDCKNSCQKDCSCTAFARMDVKSGSGCVTWKGDLTDLRKYQKPKGGQPLFVRVPNVLDEGSDLLLNTTGAEKPKSLLGSGSERRFFKVWNDIRIVILLSLSLQIILLFMPPLRKRVSSVFVSIPLWLAYTLFDIVAIYGLGLIANSQTQKSNTAAYGRIANSQTQKSNTAAYGLIANSHTQKSNTEAVDLEASYVLRSVHALWAPFLLFHLGGPDTITAFTLADNELWLRNSLALFVQGWLVSYIFAHSFFIDTSHYKRPFPDDKLWVPTMLINIAGLIKYVERTRALYLASTERFRSFSLIDPVLDPNYAKLMNEYSSKKIEMTPEPETVIPTTPEVKKMTDWEIVQAAHHFFDTFKGLVAELILSFRERTKSRGFFFQRTPRDAFKVVEVELNFIYEILYTKLVVVQSTLGYILRFVTIGLTCASLVLFYKLGSYNIERIDRTITKILHIGALALDVIGLIMAVTSDLTAVKLTKKDTILFKCLRAILHVDRDRWPEKNQADKKQSDRKKGFVKIFLSMIMEFLAKVTDYYYFREIMCRRWSELIPQYNLIHYCLNPRPELLDKVISLFNLTNMADTFQYTTSEISILNMAEHGRYISK